MANSTPDRTALGQQVASRFGLLPNFFISAPDAPELVEKLWGFAQSAYLDNPIPSLFKERLFVYLSRFCEVRYCIVRHCAFLLGLGHSSGDPTAAPQTLEQAIRLLRAPPPWQRNSDAVWEALEAGPTGVDWPAPESQLEDHLFSAAALVFVEPGRSDRARRALRHALGGERFEYLMGLLAFIRTAHYWTVVHPDLQTEEDVVSLLSANEELARLLLRDPEAGRCDMSARLFSELDDLRGLHERRELEKAKNALEAQLVQKELLLKETNHRVKNSLQIVSSILQLQIPHIKSAEAAEAMRSAAARVMAVAAVHERLYTGNDIRVVSLHTFLGDLCREMSRALGCPNGIQVDFESVEIPTDMAVPLALVVNELVTNAIKHVGAPCLVTLRMSSPTELTLSIRDGGQGPSGTASPPGMGSRIVEAFAAQLDGRIDTSHGPDGYTVALTVPVPLKR